MKTQIIKAVIISIALSALLIYPALASVITSAEYWGQVNTTNNSTASTNDVVVFDLSTPDLIANVMLNSTATDAAIRDRVGQDVYFMPGNNSTNPWVFFLPSINEAETTPYYLYTGNVTGGQYRYFTGPEGMSVVDDDSMEPGPNFAISAAGFCNTDNGTDKNIVDKPGAIFIRVSPTVSENITAGIYKAVATVNLLPNAAGDNTSLAKFGGATNWESVDDPVATPDDATTEVHSTADTYIEDLYNIQDLAILESSIVDNVTAHFRIYESGANGYAKPLLSLNGVKVIGTQVGATNSWVNHNELLTRPSGGDWTVSDINNLQVGIQLKYDPTGATIYCTQVYITVSYREPVEISATGISSDEHTIELRLGVR